MSTAMPLAFETGRPRMDADVADACGLPRSAGFLVSFFLAVTN